MAILKVTAVPEFGALNAEIQKISKKPVKITAQTQDAVENVKKVGKAAKETEKDVLHVSQAFDKLLKSQSKGFVDAENATKKATQAAEQYIRTWERAQERLAKSAPNTAIQNRINAMFPGLDGNTVKSAKASAEVFERAFSNLDAKVQKTGKSIDDVKKKTYLLGDSFGNIILKMAAWQILGNMIASVRRAFSDALETMKAVDDELVVVRKVTGAAGEELERIEKQAYKTASAYGVAADEYLKGVAAFARAGYGERATELAELSTKTQIVGDVAAETANQFLLSVDAAYKYGGSIEALSKVLDGANEIDNKYATSIEKISEGLGIVAPVAAQVHVGINELTAAIGTVTAVTQRSGSEAARALRALFLNIVGDTKTEIDEGVTWTTGEIAGLRDVIKLYAKDAYDAAEATGSVINPMEAIAGLSKSMKEGLLTEQQLMQMVSDIGGKLRTSQLLALIQNWDMYQSMLQDYAGAIGSADREVENALDSWTRKTNQLKNAWTEFIDNFVDTSVIKGALDVIIAGLNGINLLLGGDSHESKIAEYDRETQSLESELADLESRYYSLNEQERLRYENINKQIDSTKKLRALELQGSYDEWEKKRSGLTAWGLREDGSRYAMNQGQFDLEAFSNAIERATRLRDKQQISELKYREELATTLRNYEATVNEIDKYVASGIKVSEVESELSRLWHESNNNLRALNTATSDAVSVAGVMVSAEDIKKAGIDRTSDSIERQLQLLRALYQVEYNAALNKSGHDTHGRYAARNSEAYQNLVAVDNALSQLRRPITTVDSPTTNVDSPTTKSKADLLKQAMNDALEKEKERRDEEIAAIDDQIAALKEENNLEQQSLDLEEKKAEVIKRQNDLLLAQQERTIRLYNARTGQWEWVADATKVQNAQDALEKARQSLADYKRKIALDAAVKELEDRKKAIQAAYDLVEKNWKAALKAVETPAYDMAAILATLNVSLSNFNLALGGARTGIVTSPTKNPQTGVTEKEAAEYAKKQKEKEEVVYRWTSTSSGRIEDPSMAGSKAEEAAKELQREKTRQAIERMYDIGYAKDYDSGGVLHGLGGIKATGADEIVVPPAIASRMLSPSADSIFRARMSELGYMYGASTQAPPTLLSGGLGSVTNNNGATYNLGGITLTEGQAKTTTVYELAQLAHGLRVFS